jgi:hypothetical protein
VDRLDACTIPPRPARKKESGVEPPHSKESIVGTYSKKKERKKESGVEPPHSKK